MEDFKLLGIDAEFTERIYFPTQASKTEYLNAIENTLVTLSINIGDDRMSVINKIADADVDLMFLREILAYTGGIQYSKSSDRNNYYTNCKLCEYNLEAKLAANMTDFQDEEELFKSIMSVDLVGYAKANIILNMGHVFSKIGFWEKADSYFDLFRDTTFELSSATIADFYRAVAEIYLEAGKKEASLTWFKDGLRIDSKLPVKKLVKKLESE